MGFKFAGDAGHATVGAWFDYNRPEHELVTGSDKVRVYRGDGALVGVFDRRQLVAFARGEGLRRRHPRLCEGFEGAFTLPASVVGAMKDKRLLQSPGACFAPLEPSVHRAMKRLNRHAHGRTTGGKPVKVDLYYAVMYGFATRAGGVAPQPLLWVMGHGAAADSRHYAVDGRRLFRGQKAVQAAWHLGVAHALHARGITCVPDGNSIRALGVRAKAPRAKQMKAALNAGPFAGPGASQYAAQKTRPAKRKVTWYEAVANFAHKATATGRRWAKTLGDRQEERFARKCVAAGFRYCNHSGAVRYSRADVYATAAHLALPHVRPDVFDRVFDRMALRPERYGAAVERVYRDGNVLYAPVSQVRAEADFAAAVRAGHDVKQGGLTRKQVARSLAGLGLTAHDYAAVQALVDPQRVSAVRSADDRALLLATRAYERYGRTVVAVGRHVGDALDRPAYSPHGLCEAMQRTGHLSALWQGLRTKGTFLERLAAAEKIRARRPEVRLKKNSLIVAAVAPGEERALLKLLDAAARTNSKVVLAGPHAHQMAKACQEAQAGPRPMVRGARP